jgi:translation initiation factor 1A
MPKKKSNGNRRQIKNRAEASKRPLLFAEEDQSYGAVVKVLGQKRFALVDVRKKAGQDDKKPKELLAHARGSLRRRDWINVNDLVLYSTRDYQPEKVDIIHKFTGEEAHRLEQYGEIQKQLAGDRFADAQEEVDNIVFGYDSGSDCDVDAI